MMKKLYRPNVAAIIRSQSGLLFLGQRSDYRESWQFPQGGVDRGETDEEALRREVQEEVGMTPEVYTIVARRGPYVYEFPGGAMRRGFHGQRQVYFLCQLSSPGLPILDLSGTCGEFVELRWVEPVDFPLDLVPPMKQAVYRQVLRDFFPPPEEVGPDK
ncbi:MAG: NUDIX domain-containing protein [Chthoniobacterales bacterium]|jgi:putative (di)nucleoside polyphosphate hydrolase